MCEMVDVEVDGDGDGHIDSDGSLKRWKVIIHHYWGALGLQRGVPGVLDSVVCSALKQLGDMNTTWVEIWIGTFRIGSRFFTLSITIQEHKNQAKLTKKPIFKHMNRKKQW